MLLLMQAELCLGWSGGMGSPNWGAGIQGLDPGLRRYVVDVHAKGGALSSLHGRNCGLLLPPSGLYPSEPARAHFEL